MLACLLDGHVELKKMRHSDGGSGVGEEKKKRNGGEEDQYTEKIKVLKLKKRRKCKSCRSNCKSKAEANVTESKETFRNRERKQG